MRLGKGLTLNLNKKSVSLSGGVRGARLTRGKRGTSYSVGLPGTGISYRGLLRLFRRR